MIFSPPKPITIKLMPRTEYDRNQLSVIALCIVCKISNDLQIGFEGSMIRTSRQDMTNHLCCIIKISSGHRTIIMPTERNNISPIICNMEFFLYVIQFFCFPTARIRKMKEIKTSQSRISPRHIIRITSVCLIPPACTIRIEPIHFIIMLSINHPFSGQLPQVIEQCRRMFSCSRINQHQSGFCQEVPSRRYARQDAYYNNNIYSNSFH